MSKWYAQVSWEEVPHLTKEDRDDLLKTIPQYQKEARSKGIPSLGSGLIYQIGEDAIKVPDFPIPDHYKRVWGLDTGWNWTAAVWAAQDPDTQVTYLYSAYKRGQAEPATHAEAIKSRGVWIAGVGDSAQINYKDGRQLIAVYRDDHKLDIALPDKAVEAGIYKVWLAFNSGKLKVFASLGDWFTEFRFYARDGKGRIVKKDDHLMDATRYIIKSGLTRAKPKPPDDEEPEQRYTNSDSGGGWMMS